MGRTRRIHLLVGARAACRTPIFTRSTRQPRLVTCMGCQRSTHMADAELKEQQHQPRRLYRIRPERNEE